MKKNYLKKDLSSDQTDGINQLTPWSKKEELRLRKQYPNKGQAYCAKLFKRSQPSIRMKASRLGLKLSQKSKFWKEFQFRAGQTKIGRKLPPERVEKARKNRMASVAINGIRPTTDATRRKMVIITTLRWKLMRKKMMAGIVKGHTPEINLRRSETMKMKWNLNKGIWLTPANREARAAAMSKMRATRNAENSFSRCKHGKRADLDNLFFRSAWEANYARYLNFLKESDRIVGWEYEPKTFWFESIRRGARSYKPDFRVEVKKGVFEWHEVKGWLYPRSITTMKRFRKFYPEEKLVLIDQQRYKAISITAGRVIKHWEK